MGIWSLALRERAPVLKIARRAPLQLSSVPNTARGGWHTLIREPFTGAWQRNEELRLDTVAAHHAVYSCITRISQDVGKLWPVLKKKDPRTGIWTETTASAALSRVLDQPNRFQNHIQFKEWWITCKLLHGNVFVLKRRDERGKVDALYLLDPTRVTVLVATDGEVFYQLHRDDLSEVAQDIVAVPASEIVHDRFNCLFHPLVGVSPIYACGSAASMGLKIERNSSGFFGNGSNPSGILSSPLSISPLRAAELSEVWETQYGAGNSGRIAVLGSDMKFTALRMNAVDSQLIEQLKWTAETVCTAFHVPPWKLGIGQMPAYTNPQIANQTYYSDCLQSHIESLELCMDEAVEVRQTDGSAKSFGVELDLDGLLRMDTATQIDTLAKGVRGGVYTPNGARRKIDEPPLEGGDTIYLQHQDYPMEKVFNRTDLDAKEPVPIRPVAPTAPVEDDPSSDDTADRAARLARRVSRRARLHRIQAMAA